jgi:hypothetical protein
MAWASLIELLTHEPRPISSSFFRSPQSCPRAKAAEQAGQPDPLHVYVDRWVSEISQTFADAALDEQNNYLPDDLVGTARVVMENQIHEQQRFSSKLADQRILPTFRQRKNAIESTQSLTSAPSPQLRQANYITYKLLPRP